MLGPVRSVLRDGAGPIVALVKPQFEAGRADVKGGVVRDPTVHRDVLAGSSPRARELGLGTRAVIASPIQGPEGNREFLVHLQAGPSCAELDRLIDEPSTPHGRRSRSPPMPPDAHRLRLQPHQR